jgi:predicted nuclease with TOPRIM domain
MQLDASPSSRYSAAKGEIGMSQAARKWEVKDSMDERIARLEERTSHLQEDVTRIEHKLDALAAKLDALKDAFVAFQLETKDNFSKLMNSRWADKVWWLVIAGALLGVMARGFKWI